jgi:hypothetical protein
MRHDVCKDLTLRRSTMPHGKETHVPAGESVCMYAPGERGMRGMNAYMSVYSTAAVTFTPTTKS